MKIDTKITLDVTGMTCDCCERHVGDALDEAGLSNIQVDWRRGPHMQLQRQRKEPRCTDS